MPNDLGVNLTDDEIREAHQNSMSRKPIADWAASKAVWWAVETLRVASGKSGEEIAENWTAC